MPNMFDEFMEELRRRQEEREGGKKRSDAGATGEPLEDETVSSHDSGSDDGGHDEDERPWSPFERRRPVNRGGRGGGSSEMPEFKLGKGWIIFGAILAGLLVLASLFAMTVGVITDGMWFNSIGYGDVFSTRVTSQIIFFVVGGAAAFIFLWLNLWLAGRFIPKGQLRRFSLDDFLDRFSIERYMGVDSGSPFSRPRPRPVGSSAEAVQVPDLGRPVFWGLLGVGALISLAMGAMANGGWNTIQLFLH